MLCLRTVARGSLFVLVVALVGQVPRVALAQCGASASQCHACHDGTHASTPSRARWHEDHAFADLCVGCHAGDAESRDPAAAHRGLIAPLGAERLCDSCHSDEAERVERYRGLEREADAGAAVARPRRARGPADAILVWVSGIVGVLGVAFVARREHERARGAASKKGKP